MFFQREVTPERKSFILIFLLFLNLILMSFNIILKNDKSLIENIIGTLISPFQVGFQKTTDFLSHEIKRYVFLKNMYQQYYDLKNKHKELKYQNYLLRKQLTEIEFQDRIKKSNLNFIGVEVISVDNSIPFSSVFINQGSSQGIKKNMVLVNEDGELVGRVEDPITLFSAKVRLITSSLGGLGAYVKKNKLEGFLTGSNQKKCQFKYLMENAPVEIGDEVITSGTDGIFPPYLPIGKVVEIEKEYLTQKIWVKPYFSDKSIKQLVIIKSSIENIEK